MNSSVGGGAGLPRVTRYDVVHRAVDKTRN